MPTRSRSGSEVGQAHQLVVQLVRVIPRISRTGLPRLAGRELRITSAFHALVTGLNSAFTLGSQDADGGNRWLLMEIRGHLGARGHGVQEFLADFWTRRLGQLQTTLQTSGDPAEGGQSPA